MQTISRLYASKENARKAWDELKNRGFSHSYLFAPPAASEDGAPVAASTGAVLDEMVGAYILKSHAAIYARHVSQGASLVTVHAPFSGGLKATNILDRHGPMDSGVPEPASPAFLWDEKAPFSSAFRMPLLLKCAHPFEAIFGVPSLIKGNVAYRARSKPVNPTPLSSALGLPLLLRNPAPFSSLFNLPLLMKSRALFRR